MKLSEFRGKVVMLSFWATTCGPCMKMIPHERDMVERLKDKPFVLLGVNCGDEPEDLKKALDKHQISWRSFKGEQSETKSIASDWKIGGLPTIYLIDHEGIIRKYWQGRPDDEELDREVERLLDVAKKG